ncbi:PIN domain-containing protein [Alkalibaculum sp. M08DMB]|uniref:PIN domain-containing protein n=1 Tax=Alkalibaculum sporogenes TaxID=2655001 RepID=A0A6A7KCR0_9FIRM|nr:PIN/TRAM domain-containing protein [Alkalibaculum sporogenes]MPW27319.1 PIN domain-containing protein [Alkalibaculum sporogenes]
MVVKITKWIFALLGTALGYQLTRTLLNIDGVNNYITSMIEMPYTLLIYVIGGILLGFVFYLLSPYFINLGIKIGLIIEASISKLTFNEILTSTFGLIIGLIIAALVSIPISRITSAISQILIVLIYIFFGYLGISIANKNADIFNVVLNRSPKDQKPKTKNIKLYKILDTSVIIDGRIFDICRTAFIEGTIVIPRFVLVELQYIADSSDSLKRNRGRRGLDILNKIQKELPIEVMISEKDFPDVQEVDAKLLKLAQEMKGKVVTNDYNLNKVAEFQGVEVLNINELANAVKPVVLPGEQMVVNVIKDGKESGQGVAYLDDGTMIVVENGKKYVSETIEVTVTSILQTAAGRMIFAKPNKIVSKTN